MTSNFKVEGAEGESLLKCEKASSTVGSKMELTWLMPFLSKMKEEIKKEVMDEMKLIFLKEKPVKGSEAIHHGIYCDHCSKLICGIRYKCGNCDNYDLCQECENLPGIHSSHHIFLKIRNPVTLKSRQKKHKKEVAPFEAHIRMHASSSSHPNSHQGSLKKQDFDSKFIQHCEEGDIILEPSTMFVKAWKVQNCGLKQWNSDIKLHRFAGTKELIAVQSLVDVPPLKPGEEGIISVEMKTPNRCGVAQSMWLLQNEKGQFGEVLWCIVQVATPSADLDELYKHITLKPNEGPEEDMFPCCVMGMCPKYKHIKVAASHTTTPNNTPFDLTPPKSPDHNARKVEDPRIKENNETAPEASGRNDGFTLKPVQFSSEKLKTAIDSNKCSDCEEDCSIVSVSSVESDTEFVVIPMPKCFDMTESFLPHYMKKEPDTVLPTPLHQTTDIPEPKKPDPLKEAHQKCSLLLEKHIKSYRAKTVSQETGVPELSESSTVLEVIDPTFEENGNMVSKTPADGSSSEVSIIESEDSSPVNEMASGDIINITIQEWKKEEAPKVNVQFKGPQQEGEEVVHGESAPVTDIPSGTTFPKYPIASVSEAAKEEENRTVQVLPEGLVNGALCAAASMYNTAKAVINTIQQPRTERGVCLSRDLSLVDNVQQCNILSADTHKLDAMEQLIEMGFCNRNLNDSLLRKHNGDVAAVVSELVSMDDNDWYASRHVPTANFD